MQTQHEIKHPHQILGVDADVDPETTKRAYLALAKAAHPDAGGSKEEFVELRAAFEAMVSGHAPEMEQTSRQATATEVPPRSADWRSYDDIMREMHEQFEQDVEWQPTPERAERKPVRTFLGRLYSRPFVLAVSRSG